MVGITKNSVTSIRNKSYWNYNNLNPKDPVALNLFTKDLIDAIEKRRRIKREKKKKDSNNLNNTKIMIKTYGHKIIKMLSRFWRLLLK